MALLRNKTTVLSWLLLSVAGVVACWIGVFNQQFQWIYAAAPVVALGMLAWIPRQKPTQLSNFYRIVWQLQLLCIGLLSAAAAYALWLALRG